MEIVEYFAKEWDVIRQAPATFLIAFFLIAMAAYGAASWRFGGVMDSQRSQIELLQRQLDAIPGGADAERKKAIRERLARFLTETETYCGTMNEGDDSKWSTDEIDKWAEGMVEYVKSNLGEEYRVRLLSDAGLMNHVAVSWSAEKRLYKPWLQNRAKRLHDLIQDFR